MAQLSGSLISLRLSGNVFMLNSDITMELRAQSARILKVMHNASKPFCAYSNAISHPLRLLKWVTLLG